MDNDFGQPGVGGAVGGAENQDVLAGRYILQPEVKGLAKGVDYAVGGFDRGPGACVERIFAAP